mgnify:CR=1 FL=1
MEKEKNVIGYVKEKSMELQGRTEGIFQEKVDRCRKVQMEKLAGMLDGYMVDALADYKELLMEDIQEQLKILQAEIEEKVSGPDTWDEIRRQVDSGETAGFVDRKTAEFQQMFRRKEKVCVDVVQRLFLGADAGYEYREEPLEQEGFVLDVTGPDPEDRKELDAVREKKALLSEEIEKIMKDKEETENTFRELVHRNAEIRARMEEEKPAIRYTTRRVRREGFFGFLVDLFGKAQMETVTDDSELCQWQERVDAVQKEYDEQARETNERIEALKNGWREKEGEYDRLDTVQKQMEKKFREQTRREVLEELEVFLYGEGGLFDQAADGVERNFKKNAEGIRTGLWEEYQRR